MTFHLNAVETMRKMQATLADELFEQFECTSDTNSRSDTVTD